MGLRVERSTTPQLADVIRAADLDYGADPAECVRANRKFGKALRKLFGIPVGVRVGRHLTT